MIKFSQQQTSENKMARKQQNLGSYGGFSEPQRRSGGKIKWLFILLILTAFYMLYYWGTNPAYAPNWMREILPGSPVKLYQYTNSDGKVIESTRLPPNKADEAIVINRWEDKAGLLPE
jgi:hypothetical protein